MPGTRFACRDCHQRKLIHVAPSEAPITIRMGCGSEQCGDRIAVYQQVPFRAWERAREE